MGRGTGKREEKTTGALGFAQQRMALPPRSSQCQEETGTKAESPRLRVMGGKTEVSRRQGDSWHLGPEGLHRGMMSE